MIDTIDFLQQNGTIFIFTDAIYGISCSIDSELAIDKIFDIKKEIKIKLG